MTTYFFSGIAKWASRKPGKFDKYTIDMYFDDESLALFKTSGIRVSPKTDNDGDTFYKLSRHIDLTKKDGTKIDLGPPKFLNPDGTEFAGNVGNGSTVTIKVDVYDTGAGKGHRWEALRVDELVEYNPTTAVNAPAVGLPF
ncbi:hypothetical protein [Bradyrhizobium erythrophlei]|uniref:Uncharacterized protein n=1 Tax=Bradyrhizobium erythrophlei TaxID=1437360 RepID=A0A1M5TAQ2_9BRAD|nr:hypothetical protein [Bradyrhizobium erythrophlei]SHH47865.1 hypothetical protein SAMN05444169_7652 [Bradyrhizobium erythrophlei]